MYSDKLILLFLSEQDSSYECCVGLLDGSDGLDYIEKLLKGRKLKNHFLEWEDINKADVAREEIYKEQLVHLVFVTALSTPGEISFVFPGQSLMSATLEEDFAALVLEEERTSFRPELSHLWSLPVGWVAPGLEGFVERNSEAA
ncbi:hypothetical protein [Corynebacterium glutamicum]|uniref:hypothetical protein n=1 Tax=Corynebacterium glutamicum TaxID=1718 RepID=UPI0007209F5D|nr:hypothetical protein [Corynebacterium glutamicum]ALP49549.1 hypothetical protein AC079_04605 [Corynebacterium glutamicum]